jgi:hypothetical protein
VLGVNDIGKVFLGQGMFLSWLVCRRNGSAPCNQLMLDLEGHELHLMVQLNNGDSVKIWRKKPTISMDTCFQKFLQLCGEDVMEKQVMLHKVVFGQIDFILKDTSMWKLI